MSKSRTKNADKLNGAASRSLQQNFHREFARKTKSEITNINRSKEMENLTVQRIKDWCREQSNKSDEYWLKLLRVNLK